MAASWITAIRQIVHSASFQAGGLAVQRIPAHTGGVFRSRSDISNTMTSRSDDVQRDIAMNEQHMIETGARAILVATGHQVFRDQSTWEALCDRFHVASSKGEVRAFPSAIVEAYMLATAVTAAILAMPEPNPAIVIDWVQEDERTWTAAIADGWSAKVRQSLGDGTWSFIVNRSGRCYLDSKETAFRLAEENARARITDAIRHAARTSRAFGLALPVEHHEVAA